MNKLEDVLKRQLNEDRALVYPDFELMWETIGQAESIDSGRNTAGLPASGRRRTKSWGRVAGIVAISAVVAAAPVYAAIHYNWDDLLRSRDGVQAALEQNLGQQLEQTLSRDGVTLTLHTAIVDENRTVILYTLDVGERSENVFWNVENMSLQDAEGNVSGKGFNNQEWDEENQRYNGYFESEWTPQQDTVRVTLTAAAVRAFSPQTEDLPLDSGSSAVQSFPVGDGGMDSITVKPFPPNKAKRLFASSVKFGQPANKDWTFPQIIAFNGGTQVKELAGGSYGTPGDNGEYTMQQYFREADIVKGQTTYKLHYSKLEYDLDGPWSFDLELSKKQMESGTVRKMLNAPLETGDTQNTIEKVIITPTQIRLNVRLGGKGFTRDIPYKQYSLLVNGQTLEGHYWGNTAEDPAVVALKFERPAELAVDESTPITFVGKYKVTIHSDDKEPLLLTQISSVKQTVVRETGGYPVKWTYYMQDKDLYVESESDDPHFGGVNQTYIGTGKDRLIGKQVTVNFSGDGNNNAIDVYKDFKGTEASVYMFFYTTNDPDKETRVGLQP